MRVGVYADGYNLYYGGRRHFGRGTPGWRWLSPRALTDHLVRERRNWPGARIARVVYCTARVDQADTPGAWRDQDVYLQALLATGAVDHIEFGHYVRNAKTVPLARRSRTGRAQVVHPVGPLPSTSLPLRVLNDRETGQPIVLADALVREEKGSDVNVASHLLMDVLSGSVDGAVVISNDSDLALPVRVARTHVPVGVVSPSPGHIAGALRGQPTDGVGKHWWRQLQQADFRASQLPNPVPNLPRPTGW